MPAKVSESVDTGTTTVDAIDDSHGDGAVWDFKISDGTNSRSGEIHAQWDENASSTPSFALNRIQDIGTVTGITFTMDKNVNTVRLRVTSTSDDWTFKANRELIGP